MKFLIILATLLLSSQAFAGPLKWAQGEWGIASNAPDSGADIINCENSPLRIRIDRENKTYTSNLKGEATRKAKITATGTDYLTIKYDTEERLMDNGKKHIWSMYFLDKDTFVWVRQDWIVDGVRQSWTHRRQRCENLDVS